MNERQELDNEYRKFWGYKEDKDITSPPKEVLLYGIYKELRKLNKVKQ